MPPQTPNPPLPLRTAIRIAAREIRASRTRFLFVILAVAVGVGALTGVRGFSRSFRHMLLAQARTLMAGDLTLRVFALPTPAQAQTLQTLESRGVRHTWITETVTMARSPTAPDPLLISVKAVDPAAYPYYGAVVLSPPLPFRQTLTPDAVLVSSDLLLRLNTQPGATLRIGGQNFRIAATIASEPDRMTGSLNVGPRVMISREGLARTGLITLGSRAAERYLFALPPADSNPAAPTVADTRAVLKAAFPEATIADFTETHPIITRGLDRSTTFLGLIGLIALVIGAMGVASAMHGLLQQKLDSIAVMKCIGARSSQIVRIYAVQTLMLGLAGGILGAIFGIAVAAAFPRLIAQYFDLQSPLAIDPWPALQGIAIACLVTMLFTIPPLLGIRSIRPAQVFRRDMETLKRDRLPMFLAALAILTGAAAVAATVTEASWRDSLRTGAIFSASLAIGLALLSLTGWLFLRAVARAHSLRALPATLRHGIANLYRPGSQAQAAVVALGVGVMFTLTVFLVQSALLTQIRGSAPPGAPNVFLLDIPAAQRQSVVALIAQQPGIVATPEVANAVAARIVSINGTPVDNLPLRDFNRRYLRTRMVTEVDAKPTDTDVLRGAWWPQEPSQQTPASTPQVCVAEEAAAVLKLNPGDRITWDIWSHPIETRVACIERTESIRMAARFEFLFSPGQLASFPAVYYGTARVRASDVASLQRVMYQQFPTVTVVNVADVMQIVEDVVQRIAVIVRFISAFTILAGAIMVASAVAGSRFRRMREVVVLKALGATRRRIAWIFSVEFLALGAVAGIMGALLASAFAAIILKRLLDIDFHFDPAANGIAIAASAAVAAAAGWAASFRVLNRKPLEILREE